MTCEVLWVNYVIPHLLGMSWNTMWPTIFWCANSTCSGLIDENIARYYLFSPSSIQLPIYFPKISPLFFVLCVLPSTTDWDRVRSACMVRANIIKDISRQRYNWMWTCEEDGASFYIMLSQSLCQCHLINFTHTSRLFLSTIALCFDRDFGSTLYKMKMLKLQISPALTTKLSGIVSNP